MNKKRNFMLAATLSVACMALGNVFSSERNLPTGPENNHLRNLTNNRIAIHVGDKSFIVTLYDNPTANDLITRLPLTLKASNYPGYDEKIIRLPQSLSMDGAPPGDNPKIPEVGYYEPGRWIALYYGPIGYWSGKVPLGKIDASIDDLSVIPDNSQVIIELLQP